MSDNKETTSKDKPEIGKTPVSTEKTDVGSGDESTGDKVSLNLKEKLTLTESKSDAIDKVSLKEDSSNENSEGQESGVSDVETGPSPSEGDLVKEQGIKLKGLFGFKLEMSMMYNDTGEAIPVTILKSESWFVSQIKTPEREGYSAVQVAHGPLRAKKSQRSRTKHCQKAGFENGARTLREIRQNVPEGIRVGQRVSLETLSKGDRVKITSSSKGRGFAGVMKRYDFGGGPAAHGSEFHRGPGSVGNRTWPGRVVPGKKMPGRYGGNNITVRGVEILDIIPDENLIFVKGGVPGARNTLVRILKED